MMRRRLFAGGFDDRRNCNPTPARALPNVWLRSGRCQLKTGHQGQHAAKCDYGYLTWDNRHVSRWSSTALWLFDLPWADGLQPMLADL